MVKGRSHSRGLTAEARSKQSKQIELNLGGLGASAVQSACFFSKLAIFR